MNLNLKKLFKKNIKELNIDRKIFLYYSKKRHIPICAMPNLNLIMASNKSFLNFCYSFNNFYNKKIQLNNENINLISKIVIAHEIGHILDEKIYKNKAQYSLIISKLIETMLNYNFDFNNLNNLPYEIEINLLELKKNIIERETNAWEIGKNILNFSNENEIILFNKMKEYALATYNYGNYKNIIKDHNIENMFNFKKRFKLEKAL